MESTWLTHLKALQAIAQAGLAYPGDKFDKERFQQLREIVAQMMSEVTDLPAEKVTTLFCSESGFQTPKIDTRGFLYKDGKVLLVKEANGLWTLPGGWCEVTLSPAANTAKEVLEEAGHCVRVRRLLLLQTYAQHNAPEIADSVMKCFFLCEDLGGDFHANSETSEAAWFPLDDLPPLCSRRSTREQILACAERALDPSLPTGFDV